MLALRGIVFALAAVWSLAGPLGTAQAEPLRIGYLTWVGSGRCSSLRRRASSPRKASRSS